MMDEHLKYLIDYARGELDEAEHLRSMNVIDDDDVFVRLFLVGKSLVGWNGNKPVDEALELCKKINADVMDRIDNSKSIDMA